MEVELHALLKSAQRDGEPASLTPQPRLPRIRRHHFLVQLFHINFGWYASGGAAVYLSFRIL